MSALNLKIQTIYVEVDKLRLYERLAAAFNNNSGLLPTARIVVPNNTATAIANLTLASNTVAGAKASYCVEVFDGTNVQVEQGEISFIVTNKAGAIANNLVVKYGNQQAVTAGALVVTWTITAATPAVLTVNANSSLAPSAGYPIVTLQIANLCRQGIQTL